jgi:nicotinamide-nucleotide amidase
MAGRSADAGLPESEVELQDRAERLAVDVVSQAIAAGVTIAVAESLTGGLVSGTLASVPGVSAVLRGGVVSYATDLKADLLGVDVALLAEGGAVQAEVARQMASGAARRLGATHAIATTGVAGPDPQDGHEPGTVYVAVAGPSGLRTVGFDGGRRLPGDRAQVRWSTVIAALQQLGQLIAAEATETGQEEDRRSAG